MMDCIGKHRKQIHLDQKTFISSVLFVLTRARFDEWKFLKPNCFLYKHLNLSKKLYILMCIAFSRILLILDTSEIGL